MLKVDETFVDQKAWQCLLHDKIYCMNYKHGKN